MIHGRLLLRNDTDKLTSFLMGDEAANTFLLGNLLYYGVENDRRNLRCGEYRGYFADGDLVGVAAFFNNSQCMVYHTDEGIVNQIASDISDGSARLALGSDRCVRPILPLLKGIQGRIAVHSQLFMELAGAAAPAPSRNDAFEFEDARAQSCSRAVQDFILRCMKEGFGFSVSRGTVKRLLREKTEYEPYLLLKAGGKYVAQAHIQARTPGFRQIGGVCTLPEERRRGYARAIVARLIGLTAHDGGRKACLVVNEDNGAARKLYEEMGFKETGRLILIDF